MISPVSFKANYISTKTVLQNSSNTEVKTSFVELNPLSCKDRKAVAAVDCAWNDAETFAHHILCEMEGCLWHIDVQKFYALTTQKKDFETLVPDKILGLAEVIDTGLEQIKIKFLQVNPKTNMFSNNPKYIGIGCSILDSIKSVFHDKNIVLESVDNQRIIDFYERNGFQRLSKAGTSMIFKR